MKTYILFLSALLLTGSLLYAELKPSRLTCEYLKDPQVIDVAHPSYREVNLAGAGYADSFRPPGNKGCLPTAKSFFSGELTCGTAAGYIGSPLMFPYEEGN